MSVSSFLFKQSATLTDNQCYKIPRGFQLCVYQRHIQMPLVDTDAARRHHAIEALSTILAFRAGCDENADYKYLMICYITLAISRVVILCMFTSMQGALDDFVSCPLHHIYISTQTTVWPKVTQNHKSWFSNELWSFHSNPFQCKYSEVWRKNLYLPSDPFVVWKAMCAYNVFTRYSCCPWWCWITLCRGRRAHFKSGMCCCSNKWFWVPLLMQINRH